MDIDAQSQNVPEAEINRRADHMRELTEKCLDEGIKEDDLAVLALFLTDAIMTEDADTISVVFDFAQRAQSPALGLSSVDMAQALSLGEVAYCASMRLLPEPSDAELTYLQMADGRAYNKEEGSDFTQEEWRLINLGCLVCRGLRMELTPRGSAVLDRNRIKLEDSE